MGLSLKQLRFAAGMHAVHAIPAVKHEQFVDEHLAPMPHVQQRTMLDALAAATCCTSSPSFRLRSFIPADAAVAAAQPS